MVVLLVFAANQGPLQDAIFTVINQALQGGEDSGEIVSYSWQEAGCSCNNTCGYGLMDCATLQCIRDGDGLIVDNSYCGGVAYGMVGGACLDTSACCGNGAVDSFPAAGYEETCDGANLGAGNCSDIATGHNTTNGLACDGTCQLDYTSCERCGDSIIQTTWEECEQGPPEDLNGGSCVTEGFDGGTLICAIDCQYDEDPCYVCGDDEIEGPEDCEPGTYTPANCKGMVIPVECSGGPGGQCNVGTTSCYVSSCMFDYTGCAFVNADCVDGGGLVVDISTDAYIDWCFADSDQELIDDTLFEFVGSMASCALGVKCQAACIAPYVYTAGACVCPGTPPLDELSLGECGCPAGYFVEDISTMCPVAQCDATGCGTGCIREYSP